jgi:hypothetical protein
MHMRRETAGDAERIAEIYNWYILNTIITFETNVVSPPEMTKRIQAKFSSMTGSWVKCIKKSLAMPIMTHSGPGLHIIIQWNRPFTWHRKAWAGDLAGLCTFNCWSQHGAADSEKSWE